MSSYTTMILACGSSDAYTKTSELNAALEAMEITPFSGKVEDCVGVLSHNYLPSDWVIDAINAMQWNSPGCVQVFIRTEHDRLFTPVEVHPLDMPRLTMFQRDGEWFTEYDPEPLPALVDVADKVFGSVSAITVRAVIAERLGKFEEYVSGLREDELNILGLGGQE